MTLSVFVVQCGTVLEIFTRYLHSFCVRLGLPTLFQLILSLGRAMASAWDASLLSNDLQPGGCWFSSGSCSMFATDHQVKSNASFSCKMTTESESSLK